jgi:carboxymethylenebutenolidase
MKIMTLTMPVVLALICATTPAAGLRGSTVKFGPDGKFSGYFFKPAGDGSFPALVMIHEWWGLNDYVKGAADQLAGDGYVVLAVDLFGKSTTDPAEAFRMVRGLNQLNATTNMLSAADYLRTRPYVNPNKVGSIGWCFGGGQSLQLALNDPKLACAVIYYGQPVTDVGQLGKIKAAIQGVFGEADQSIPMADVDAFKKALRKAEVGYVIYTYPGAGHAFASPTHGPNYRPLDAADAWKKTTEFLSKRLKSG